jgi:O-glycosyl hydrolase
MRYLFYPILLLAALVFSTRGALAAPVSSPDDYAVKVCFSSDYHPKDARWFKTPWPETEWTYRLSPQTPLWLTAKDPTSSLETIQVDSSKTYQTVLGMGTSLEETSIYALTKNHTDAQIKDILRALIDPTNGIGMNLFRITIGTSDFSDARAVSGNPQGFYTYQDAPTDAFSIEKDRQLHILHVLKLAMEVGKETGQPIRFFASAWSPPGWMKDSGKLVGGKLLTDKIPDYAAYLRKFVQAYQAEGVPIYAITTNNEHYFAPNQYPGCFFDAEQEKLLVEAIGREFKQAGLDTRIWILDHNFDIWKQAAKTLAGLKADSAEDYGFVDGTAFHHYGGKAIQMAKLAEAFPDKSIQFTEGAKWGTSGMDDIAQIFRNGSSSYVSWVTMTTQTSEEHIQGNYNKPPALSPVLLVKKDGPGPDWYKIPEYNLYGQFMKFIRPGAVRIQSDPGSAESTTNVAFKNPDGSIVIVAINQCEWTQDVCFVVDGNQLLASLPPSTVATYVMKSGLPPSPVAAHGLPDIGARIPPPTGTGTIVKEWWLNPTGKGRGFDTILLDPRFPASPSGEKILTSAQTRDEWKVGSATRIRGFIHPNITGNYVLYIAGDQSAELFLSTDDSPANKKQVALCPRWAANFESHPEQVSASIPLVAGKKYYFETLQIGGGGNGYTNVGWDLPGVASQKIISGNFLSPP